MGESGSRRYQSLLEPTLAQEGNFLAGYAMTNFTSDFSTNLFSSMWHPSAEHQDSWRWRRSSWKLALAGQPAERWPPYLWWFPHQQRVGDVCCSLLLQVGHFDILQETTSSFRLLCWTSSRFSLTIPFLSFVLQRQYVWMAGFARPSEPAGREPKRSVHKCCQYHFASSI